MAARRKSARKPPWKRAAPAGSAHHTLTPRKKARAKAKARRAGRPYPNLVDNMREAAKSTRRSRTKK